MDHLILGAPDLASGCRALERRLGVRPVPGGLHPRWGTRNALVSLGRGTYLEVLSPDPEAEVDGGRLFGVDWLDQPRLVAWVLAVEDAERAAVRVAEAGGEIGEVSAGHRERPDGTVLRWKLSDPAHPGVGFETPFLIEWGTSRHPSLDAPHAGHLRSLGAVHPDPEMARTRLSTFGVELRVESGPERGLVAVIGTRSGDVVLR